jgi:hypothetical protein
MTRILLTADQRRQRKRARHLGKLAARSIHYALHPVYDDDGESWTRTAVSYAREAWRYALLAERSIAEQRS